MTSDELVAFAEGLGRIAAAGGGATALAHHLAETANAGVLVEDAEWGHIAAAGGGDLPASVRDLLEVRPEGDRAPRALRNGVVGHAVPIVAGDTCLGWVTIFEPAAGSKQSLDQLRHALRLTASAIAIELARESGGERGRRRAFWERLIAHEYHDQNAARDDAAARGIRLATHYVAVALEAEIADETGAAGDMAELRAIASEAFSTGELDLGAIARGTTLLLLVPGIREIDASNARTAAVLLPRTVGKRNAALIFNGGVGATVPCTNAELSVAQAEAALAIGKRIFGSGYVGVYDDLGAYPLLLGGAAPAELRAFSDRALQPLRAYDEKHQTELERTLRLYFLVGQNVKTAAAQLHVHRHTVFYRLRQINEICARSLDSAHDQLTLRMAMAIDALHSQRT
jgi:purine catabolism regulator